jgi:hypothetical protein
MDGAGIGQRGREPMPKYSKKSVRYTDDHGDSPEQCSKCAHYLPPSECKIVEGKIRSKGWCNQFVWEK